LADWFGGLFAGLLIDWLIGLQVCWFVGLLVCWLIDLLFGQWVA